MLGNFSEDVRNHSRSKNLAARSSELRISVVQYRLEPAGGYNNILSVAKPMVTTAPQSPYRVPTPKNFD